MIRRLWARWFCKHHKDKAIRVRDHRGYGETCSSCGRHKVIFRSVQPQPKQPATLPAVKRSEPVSADRWSRYQ